MRAPLYFFAWMQLFSGAISFAKGPEDCTRSALRSLFQEPVQTEKLTETVDLLYYPKAGYLFISHVELGVKDRVWQTLVSAIEKGSLGAAERKAMQGARSFYRFRLKASPD
ncbi:MAG: hypothetical protein KGP28_09555 [Bdellovibrionales bacterium]|nr:hypothetical protein [Bdellovibrionales bacterium]